MSTSGDDVHLLPLNDYNDSDDLSSESEDSDSIKVVLNIDEEHEIIDMTKYLEVNSDDESELTDDDNRSPTDNISRSRTARNIDANRDLTFDIVNDNRLPTDNINNSCTAMTVDANRDPTLDIVNNYRAPFNNSSDDDDDDDDDRVESSPLNVSDASSSYSPLIRNGSTGSTEKLRAIAAYQLNQKKRRTAAEHGCTPAQLRKWLKNVSELTNIAKEKKGKKRRRIGGADKKLKYVDLDIQLLAWYRERRTKIDPNSTTSSTDIRREKVSFKQLQRQGAKISIDLKHEQPSSKWYNRFMKRHKLSLQRPKRKQKVELSEAYKLVASFHTYLRRASTWAPKRGPMGACTPRDVCNMDETPLELFGDQSKRSINDIGTPNDIAGHLNDKRFATLILTVFGDDNHVGSVLIFKGKGQVSAREKSEYAQGVTVLFTPKAVINGPSMQRYVHLWWSKVKDNHPKLFIADSAGSHLDAGIIRDSRRKRVAVAIIPKGCTMYVQVLDVSVFSVFKHHYDDVVEEFLDSKGPRSKIKLTASQSRILCTRFTWSAWLRTLKTVDFKKAFQDVGYIWTDDSTITLRSIPGYKFDPTSVNGLSTDNGNDGNDDDVNRIDKIAQETLEKEQQLTKVTLNQTKQLTIINMWKNKN